MRISFNTLGQAQKQSLAARVAGAVFGVVVFGAALMFSVVFFALIALAALVFGGYFWWKTRALRRAARERTRTGGEAPESDTPGQAGRGESLIIEGEAVRVDEDRLRLK